MIQHIVLFTPRTELDQSQRRSFAQSAIDVVGSSRDVSRVTMGRRVDVDAGYPRSFGDQTYDYAAVLEFEDRAALVRYLNSESHATLGRLFWENCLGAVVCEVETVDTSDGGAADRLI